MSNYWKRKSKAIGIKFYSRSDFMAKFEELDKFVHDDREPLQSWENTIDYIVKWGMWVDMCRELDKDK